MPTPPWDSGYTQIGAALADGVLDLTLRRPEHLNAITYVVVEELTQAIEWCASDEGVRAVTLSGEGERAFSSGDDLSGMGPRPVDRDGQPHHILVKAIRALPKPVVALLKGYCLGAGFDLALACDIRLAADNLQMGDQRPMRAIATLAGAGWFLPRIVGVGRASELLMTGRRCGAEESERIGMVNAVWPLSEFDGKAREYVLTLARMPTFCIGTNKTNIEFGLASELEPYLAAEIVRFRTNSRSPDAMEGRVSFREKRDPVYDGRPPAPLPYA